MVESKKELLYKSLQVMPCGKDHFELLKEFKYGDYIVPLGYKTNGADVPRIAWSLFPPNRPEYLPAVVIHDFLCDQKRFAEADKAFKDCMKDLEVNIIKIHAMHKSVLSWHYAKYYVPAKLTGKKKYIN